MSFYTNENGVSPIIATLMLILITIIAASALAVISSQLLEDHAGRVELRAAVEGENLRIADIRLFNRTSSTIMPHQLNYINITAHNMDIKSVSILNVMINNNHVMNFTAINESGRLFNFTDRLSIPGREHRILIINLSNLSHGARPIFNNESIHVEIMTSRVNIFRRVFTPPVAIPIVDVRSEFRPHTLIINNTTSNILIPINILILDASRSFDPDRDGFIVSHNWDIRYTNISPTREIHNIFLIGQKVRPTFINTTTHSPINATNIKPSLTITDNTGMVSRLENFTNLTGHFNWTA